MVLNQKISMATLYFQIRNYTMRKRVFQKHPNLTLIWIGQPCCWNHVAVMFMSGIPVTVGNKLVSIYCSSIYFWAVNIPSIKKSPLYLPLHCPHSFENIGYKYGYIRCHAMKKIIPLIRIFRYRFNVLQIATSVRIISYYVRQFGDFQ